MMESSKVDNTLNIDMDIPQAKIAKFWEGLKQGQLLATRCKKCGKVHFPPVVDCSECYSSDMDWIELAGDAELVTWTVVQIAPRSFSQYSPYVIAVAKLREGPSIMAWLPNIKHKNIKPGIELKLVNKEIPNGKLSYELVPRL